MAFVIDSSCCKDASCVEVCPAQCIHPRPDDPAFESAEQLYIDPRACIDCGACVIECPVGAISHESDLIADNAIYADINRDFFARNPTDEPVRPYDNGWISPSTVGGAGAVAIIGAGAAGCYLASELSDRGFFVDVFDRLPVPFGLVRFGVAPDHQQTKDISHLFRSILERSGVEFYGGIEVGVDIPLEDLTSSYHAVVVATGAEIDRPAPVKGAGLAGVFSGRRFAHWLNGHPEVSSDAVALRGESVVIIGAGNVALDTARALLNPDHAYGDGVLTTAVREALRASTVREVHIVARRDLQDVPFSVNQLADLVGIADVAVEAKGWSAHGVDGENPGRRDAGEILNSAVRLSSGQSRPKNLTFWFRTQVLEICGAQHVSAVRLETTTSSHSDGSTPTITSIVDADNVITSIGQSPRDFVAGVDAASPDTDLSIALDPGFENAHIRAALYRVGWARRDGRGVIGSNKLDARAVAKHIAARSQDGSLPAPRRSRDDLLSRVARIGGRRHGVEAAR